MVGMWLMFLFLFLFFPDLHLERNDPNSTDTCEDGGDADDRRRTTNDDDDNDANKGKRRFLGQSRMMVATLGRLVDADVLCYFTLVFSFHQATADTGTMSGSLPGSIAAHDTKGAKGHDRGTMVALRTGRGA